MNLIRECAREIIISHLCDLCGEDAIVRSEALYFDVVQNTYVETGDKSQPLVRVNGKFINNPLIAHLVTCLSQIETNDEILVQWEKQLFSPLHFLLVRFNSIPQFECIINSKKLILIQ